MIELNARLGSGPDRCIKIIALGGAGANALDRMVLDGVNPVHLIAANSDALALNASVAGEKIQFGRNATRGLGSGGDPDLGRAAAQEATEEIRSVLDGVDCVFLLAGLGGGTGSGAAPVVAELAREAGTLVIAVVTLPFAFEGKRRVRQATESLALLQQHADAVVCFENDRIADAVSPKAGVQQAFAAADQTISQSVLAIASLFSREGIIHLGLDDFKAALQPAPGLSSRCLFGYGEAEGDNRPYDALARALKSPLMDKGRLLRECETVLIQVSGGADLTLNELQLLMEEFNRYVEERTRILFGAAVDPALAGRITVTVLSALGAGEIIPANPALPAIKAMPFPLPHIVPEPVSTPDVPSYGHTPAAESSEEEYEGNEVTEIPALVEPVIAEDPEQEDFSDQPVESVAQMEPTEMESEPEPPVEKPAKRRNWNEIAQTSLFGEPVENSTPQEQPARITLPTPAPTRAPAAFTPPPAHIKATPEPIPEPIAPAPQPVAPSLGKPKPSAAPASRPAAAPVTSTPAPVAPAPSKTPQQETLKFESVTRGRFEKSEPTIVDGQDLDVPTFLRRNVRIR